MVAGQGPGEPGALCPAVLLLACPEDARIPAQTLPFPTLALEHLCLSHD